MILNEDCIKRVYSYLYDVENSCVTNIENLRDYCTSIRVCREFSVLKKKCGLIFMYVPKDATKLVTLYECATHCDKSCNNIRAICLLNTMSREQSKMVNNYQELCFESEEESNLCLPYLKEYFRIAYISDCKKKVYILSGKERYACMM